MEGAGKSGNKMLKFVTKNEFIYQVLLAICAVLEYNAVEWLFM